MCCEEFVSSLSTLGLSVREDKLQCIGPSYDAPYCFHVTYLTWEAVDAALTVHVTVGNGYAVTGHCRSIQSPALK